MPNFKLISQVLLRYATSNKNRIEAIAEKRSDLEKVYLWFFAPFEL